MVQIFTSVSPCQSIQMGIEVMYVGSEHFHLKCPKFSEIGQGLVVKGLGGTSFSYFPQLHLEVEV